jgi:hypothetical protein
MPNWRRPDFSRLGQLTKTSLKAHDLKIGAGAQLTFGCHEGWMAVVEPLISQ